MVLSLDHKSGNAATYYQILNIPPSASHADIKEAFRQLVVLHHPDKILRRSNTSTTCIAQESAISSYHRIQEAYDTLRDAERRKEYDQRLLQIRSKSCCIVSGHSIRVQLSDMHSEMVDVVVDQYPNDKTQQCQAEKMYSLQCRCGDRIEILESDFSGNNNITSGENKDLAFSCPSCSFSIQISIS